VEWLPVEPGREYNFAWLRLIKCVAKTHSTFVIQVRYHSFILHLSEFLNSVVCGAVASGSRMNIHLMGHHRLRTTITANWRYKNIGYAVTLNSDIETSDIFSPSWSPTIFSLRGMRGRVPGSRNVFFYCTKIRLQNMSSREFCTNNYFQSFITNDTTVWLHCQNIMHHQNRYLNFLGIRNGYFYVSKTPEYGFQHNVIFYTAYKYTILPNETSGQYLRKFWFQKVLRRQYIGYSLSSGRRYYTSGMATSWTRERV
jgi:hypothetical protein